MDDLKQTIATFDKYAAEYQNKYMDHGPYVETYGPLSDLLAAEASILDAASGPGNIARFLLKDFPKRKLHGIDLSPKMIELAKSNNPTATFTVMDCRQIASLGGHYDAIIAGFCFPYLTREEVAKFIRDAQDMLNPGGILYVSFMEGDYTDSGLQSRNNIDWVCTYYHNTDLLIETLKSRGFEIIEVIRQAFTSDDLPDATDVFIYARLA
ncbi:class I SAM-dependent methyltransferase [Pseudohongiella acticola]|jgi:cyclopropane fatty-acyl-phospholipid synthase-like methyltransferase|uniref:class I SAM-dependent DNA methyltransferase n=1 Tax=Pseudohongiella acticola TaxID=1524254 RepID=UPI0030EE634F